MEAEEVEEGRVVKVLRDPGLPTEKEIETHNATHVPHRAWCPSCVPGRARDRAHFAAVPDDVKDTPQNVFDCCFLKTEGEAETVAIQVARDRRARFTTLSGRGEESEGKDHHSRKLTCRR